MTMPATTVPDAAIDSFATGIAGTVHLPGSPGYDSLALPWNVAVPNRPIAVVEADSAEDVVATVRHANEHGLRVSVQATGHGAVEYEERGLQVNTSALRELTISASGAVRAGAGLVWKDVIDAAAPLGFAALAGSAPGVGVVGFLTGGGIGPVARTYGVSADYVTAFDVVTGDGLLRRASATENPALFWGLRGGKGALGIVTAVEFDLVPLVTMLGGCLYFDGADAATVLQRWAKWTATLPEQATSSVAVIRLPALPGVPEALAGRVAVAVRFAWVGDPDEGRRVLAEIESAGPIIFGGVDVMPYSAVGMIHSDPVDPMPTYEAGTLLNSLTGEAVDTIVNLAGPDADCPQIIVELRHLGGAISREQGGPSAVSHREAAYSFLTIGIAAPPVLDATRDHAAEALRALTPWSEGTCLPNFHACADPVEFARKYDTATLDRLATLTTAYDPSGVIAYGHIVRAAASIPR
ncbi:FAD-binding oxidoreductase [Jatrophihabitans telluris]|uniref:FAD-binding oxidoreductase n=1 Tax=Jatrophihabitans telluris TaxID=2038343 RepID=A0ABY4QT67_9ACTN|nr:FAD-binding oxidoreductase [Jatrophihabitans telluris]UQX86885.1 FAD-binding oxidoreductase [Jatrophihabitans telluris]